MDKKISLSISTEALQKAIQVIKQVPVNAAIESSQFVKVVCQGGNMRLALSGEALGVANIPVKTKEDFTAFLDRKPLEAYLGSAADKETPWIVTAGSVDLGGAAKNHLHLNNHAAVTGYAKWDREKAIPVTIPDTIKGDLAWLANYVALGPPLEQYTAIRGFKDYGVVSTDTFAIAVHLDAGLKSSFRVTPLVSNLLADGVKLLSTDIGTGAVFGRGYVYQTFSQTREAYNLKGTQALVSACVKAKPKALFKASKAIQAFQYLKQFGTLDAIGKVLLGGGTKSLQISADLVGGRARSEFQATVNELVEGSWDAAKLLPFLERIVNIDDEATIYYSSTDVAHQFHYKGRYVLILVKQ